MSILFAIYEFVISPVGRWVVVVTIALSFLGANDLYFYNKGANHVQEKWDAAVQEAIKNGNAARSGAESDVANGVRDNFNRDQ